MSDDRTLDISPTPVDPIPVVNDPRQSHWEQLKLRMMVNATGATALSCTLLSAAFCAAGTRIIEMNFEKQAKVPTLSYYVKPVAQMIFSRLPMAIGALWATDALIAQYLDYNDQERLNGPSREFIAYAIGGLAYIRAPTTSPMATTMAQVMTLAFPIFGVQLAYWIRAKKDFFASHPSISFVPEVVPVPGPWKWKSL
jgi:hypothetical protein